MREKFRLPPLAVAIVLAVLMFYFRADHVDIELPQSLRSIMAGLLIFGGGVVCVLGVADFKKHRTTVNPNKPESTSVLVTTGVYRISRNPMYLGFALALLGLGIYLSTVMSLLMVPLFVFYMNLVQIHTEETALGKLFPEDYAQYKQRVRRWL